MKKPPKETQKHTQTDTDRTAAPCAVFKSAHYGAATDVHKEESPQELRTCTSDTR